VVADAGYRAPVNLKDELAKIVNVCHRTLFTTTSGRLGGGMKGMPVVLLTTTGRTTGKQRSTMLTAPVIDGDTVVLVGSNGGDDREPAWTRNLRANPEVDLTRDGRTAVMTARVASADERAALWPRVTAAYKGYGDYQQRTSREIPLVILTPR
jgi:deazaflavin-dependent oxidoreductase (nitroreductase family)